MKNPWLSISYDDYEGHMNDPAVKQLDVLREITRNILGSFQPEKFAIIGCSAGNGLEYIDNNVTKEVHAIDINPDYLEVTRKRYGGKIDGLKLHELDITQDNIDIKDINLVLAALILEYVDIYLIIPKLSKIIASNGYLIIVIQKNSGIEAITPTQFKSLKKLESLSQEIDEKELISVLEINNLKLEHRKRKVLNENKSFVILTLNKTG